MNTVSYGTETRVIHYEKDGKVFCGQPGLINELVIYPAGTKEVTCGRCKSKKIRFDKFHKAIKRVNQSDGKGLV